MTRSILAHVVMWALAVPAFATTPLEDAVARLSAGHNEEAARALEPIVATNPYEGMAAYYLGVALERSGRCPEALTHFDAALKLGANGERNGMRSANLRAAECLAEMGRPEESAARVREAWAHWTAADVTRLTEEDVYAPVRERGLLVPLTGRTAVADAGGPVERMHADLAFFDQLVRETHPDPFHQISEAVWRKAVASIDTRIPTLDPPRFNLELMRLGAMLGDGHTSVFPTSEGDDTWHLLPFYPLRLANGWVIAAATPEHGELIGARIDAVGGKPFDEVFAEVDEVVPGDNEITALWLAGVALQCYETYEGLGFAHGGAVSLDVTLTSGEQLSVHLEAGQINRDPNARRAPDDWPRIGKRTLWLADPARPFSTHWIEDEHVLYVQLNQVANSEEQTMAQFGEAVLAELRQRKARGLVLDLRHNNGGTTFVSYPFLRSIARYEPFDRPGSIVALIGPRSYSATMDLAGRLQRDMGALFVGWPTGGRPNGYSTERPFVLPYSGISGTISARWHQDGMGGDDHRPWIAPDVAVWPTMADIAAGRDPVLEAALRLIGNK